MGTRGKILAFLALAILVSGVLPSLSYSHDGEDDDFVPVEELDDTSNPNLQHFHYEYLANKESSPLYEPVRKAMAPALKGTYADLSKYPDSNLMIGLTEFDLNNDKVAEIIAFPVETMDMGDEICGRQELCPHHIIDVSGKTPKVIGILPAFAVDRGDKIQNGYWTLKAFTKQDQPENFSYFDPYIFDKEKKTYVRGEVSEEDTAE